jgi:hypothetical protein
MPDPASEPDVAPASPDAAPVRPDAPPVAPDRLLVRPDRPPAAEPAEPISGPTTGTWPSRPCSIAVADVLVLATPLLLPRHEHAPQPEPQLARSPT